MAFINKVVVFVAALILASSPASTGPTVYPPPATLYGTNQRICSYQYAIPYGGNCVQYGPAIEQKLDEFQQEVDRMKFQYVSQNTILQEQMGKISRLATATEASVQDLTKQFHGLQNTIGTLQNIVNGLVTSGVSSGGGGGGASGPTNTMLQQLITTTKTKLEQDMLLLEQEVNSIKTAHQRDSIEQSKVDSALQAQISQQQNDEKLLQQDLNNLKNIVNGLSLRVSNIHLQPQQPPQTAPQAQTTTTVPTTTTTTTTTTAKTTTVPTTQRPTNPPATTTAPVVTTASTSTQRTTPGSTTVNPLLTQLEQTVQSLEKRLSTLEQGFQTEVADLKKNISDLEAQGRNHSMEVSNVAVELEFLLVNKIPDLEKQVQTNYGAISMLNRFRQNEYQALETQVQKIAQNVTGMQTQITGLGTNTLNHVMSVRKNEQDIADLGLQVRILSSRLSRLQQAANVTLPPPTTRPTTTTTTLPTTTKFFSFVPTPRPHNG